MAKYEGIKLIGRSKRGEGYRFRGYFRPFKGGEQIQRNILAKNESEAYYKLQDIIAEYRKGLSLPREDRDRLSADFNEVWEKLHQDILSDNYSKETERHYRATFRRMFVDFRGKYYPHVKNINQLSLPFFKEYKNYYSGEVNTPEGWGVELSFVKAMMKRLYQLGYCKEEIIKKLKELPKPRANKREYPEIPKTKIEKLLSYIKKNRPDYYPLFVFMCRTGRRRNETILIEKTDVVLRGFKPIGINIRAETTKTKEKAPLNYLDEDLERLIWKAMRNNKTKWLFPNRLGRRCTPNRITDYLKKASSKAIGTTITPHYFRHRFITECAKANMPMADVKAISGIRDNDVLLEHYSHSTTAGQKNVLDTMRL